MQVFLNMNLHRKKGASYLEINPWIGERGKYKEAHPPMDNYTNLELDLPKRMGHLGERKLRELGIRKTSKVTKETVHKIVYPLPNMNIYQ